MSTKIYANARFAFREDTLENWMANNPVLEKGEPAIVRDGENGEWLKIGDGVTAFNNLPWKKGPKGDKGHKGDSGKDAIVELSYNPLSENAQSGKAVAEALTPILEQIENIGTGGASEQWEHIETITLTENANQLYKNKEPDGTPFAFRKMKVIINNADGGTANAYVNMGAYAYYRLQDKIAYIELFIECGYLWARTYSNVNEYTQWFNSSKPFSKNIIDYLRITGNGTLLAGTTFEIWGVRA